MSNHLVKCVQTTPYLDQNPGTSGLRKRCKIYTQKDYTENFLQSIFDNIYPEIRETGCLIIGGDGRYLTKEVAIKSVQMAAANRFRKVMVCKDGLGSTPAISHLIKKFQTTGALILTASHNPGGPEGDFGIKYNVQTGGGAPESVTNAIFETSKKLKSYYICPYLVPDLRNISSLEYQVEHLDGEVRTFEVEVIDAVIDYVSYMQTIFDFEFIKSFIDKGLGDKPTKICIDSRNGIAGIYCTSIFRDVMGLPEEYIKNSTPLADFGGLHPDPNPFYAADFIQKIVDEECEFGASFDGDADRCMIIGKNGFYVSPSDTVAVISASALKCIPYFKKKGHLNGLARSMPTSCALDKVAEFLSIECGRTCECYEVPTGWKFFCNLMDAGKVDICGEESFGGSSTHIREKDGIWVCLGNAFDNLAWLSVLAYHRKSVSEIMCDHWRKFGRHYYSRHDYEDLSSEQGQAVLQTLQILIDSDIQGREFKTHNRTTRVSRADNFQYLDPVDHSSSFNQGYRIMFENQDRIVVRMSGTGSQGATIRIYVEHYEKDFEKMFVETQEALSDLIHLADQLTNIKLITGRDKPTVIS
ncbi:Phosphoglucomutase-1 [Thelohanellus kitauei]|uniref:phosphoglucomutase (alpha-D-glucose-1,6-bisphosphate-dependent) n=1 Tax=Thelohanellus kitauei TaxID=669202 RepID=A0A0C2NJL2_THEKT|nr:Phosphoglucomutase-1 [Thelohanellus kitauei]